MTITMPPLTKTIYEKLDELLPTKLGLDNVDRGDVIYYAACAAADELLGADPVELVKMVNDQRDAENVEVPPAAIIRVEEPEPQQFQVSIRFIPFMNIGSDAHNLAGLMVERGMGLIEAEEVQVTT